MIYKQCPKCNKLSSDHVICGYCGYEITAPVRPTHAISVFASGYYEHIDSEPIYIKNRQQLRDETRKRGQVSNYVEGA